MMWAAAVDARKDNVEGTQRRKRSHLIVTVTGGTLAIIS